MEGETEGEPSSSPSYELVFQGAVAGENTQEATDRISILQDEINRLDQHEKMLDQHKLVSAQIFVNILKYNVLVEGRG